jgi:PilZ domain
MSALLFDWVLWLSLAMGAGVSGFVYIVGRRVSRRRNKGTHREEDLPWEALLGVLKERYRGKSAADEELSSDELMDALLKDMPNTQGITEEDARWVPGSERRRNRRRWANPVEVMLISPFHAAPVHGLVINRSAGGLAILTDVPFDANTSLSVRAIETPQGVGYADVMVRHARQVGKLWLIGCQYKDDVPWNVKVWFG